ncbi:MAG: acetolactate synthase small subunit [Clostridiales bacterium]|jgi:acetolactate synthase-1/3 small subunit|nr:acetolactate synthase small subunit [Clostridiales bacterium]
MNQNKHTIFLLVANKHGVLTRISGLFAKRAYNIDNLSVGRTDDPEISRMTVVVECGEALVEQIVQQLRKLVDVIAAEAADPQNTVERELLLVKIKNCADTGGQLTEAVNIFRGRVVDMTPDSLIVEITGEEDKLNAFINYVQKFGVVELSRTGVTALERGKTALAERSESWT